MDNTFTTLSAVDVNKHIEKKGRFSYLSWPFAFSELFSRYPDAKIDVRDWDGFPAVKSPAKGWMVCVSVTIGQNVRTQWHPVLDNNNKTIAEPDTFQINTSIQRGAVKAIALHGLGLYIYAGEDLPDAPMGDVRPNAGVEEGFDKETLDFLYDEADKVGVIFENEGPEAAQKYMTGLNLANEEKVVLWGKLKSNHRTAIEKVTA